MVCAADFGTGCGTGFGTGELGCGDMDPGTDPAQRGRWSDDPTVSMRSDSEAQPSDDDGWPEPDDAWSQPDDDAARRRGGAHRAPDRPTEVLPPMPAAAPPSMP